MAGISSVGETLFSSMMLHWCVSRVLLLLMNSLWWGCVGVLLCRISKNFINLYSPPFLPSILIVLSTIHFGPILAVVSTIYTDGCFYSSTWRFFLPIILTVALHWWLFLPFKLLFVSIIYIGLWLFLPFILMVVSTTLTYRWFVHTEKLMGVPSIGNCCALNSGEWFLGSLQTSSFCLWYL